MALLDVRDLTTHFSTDDGVVRAVDGVSFSVEKGKTLAIVGESGSGKSVTCLTIMGLNTGRVQTTGEAMFDGTDLITLPKRELREYRGKRISMIFQDPMTSLNPVHTIGRQLREAVMLHEGATKAQANSRALEMLRAVRIPRADARLDDFPHQFSGGMRQRVMIAMALSCDPKVLIADEPTTALDVTIQAQILELIGALRKRTRMSVVLITHDMGVVAELADRVLVMYGGRIVEQGPTRAIFHDPLHPYTWGLLGSIARLDRPRPHRLTAIGGSPAPAWATPSGCVFADRCPHRFERCSEPPPLVAKRGAEDHLDACWLPIEKRGELR